jgi:hypothetical protein
VVQQGAVRAADVRDDPARGQLVLVHERAASDLAAAGHGRVLQFAEPAGLVDPLEERLAEVMRRGVLAGAHRLQ